MTNRNSYLLISLLVAFCMDMPFGTFLMFTLCFLSCVISFFERRQKRKSEISNFNGFLIVLSVIFFGLDLFLFGLIFSIWSLWKFISEEN